MMSVSPQRFIPVNKDHVGSAARCELVPLGSNTWTWIIRAESATFDDFFSMYNAAASGLLVRYSSIRIYPAPDQSISQNLCKQLWLCRTESEGTGNDWTVGSSALDTQYGTAIKMDLRNPDFPYAMPSGITGHVFPTVTRTQWISTRWLGGDSDGKPLTPFVEMLPRTRKLGQQFTLDEEEGMVVEAVSSWTGYVAAQITFTLEPKRRKR